SDLTCALGATPAGARPLAGPLMLAVLEPRERALPTRASPLHAGPRADNRSRRGAGDRSGPAGNARRMSSAAESRRTNAKLPLRHRSDAHSPRNHQGQRMLFQQDSTSFWSRLLIPLRFLTKDAPARLL